MMSMDVGGGNGYRKFTIRVIRLRLSATVRHLSRNSYAMQLRPIAYMCNKINKLMNITFT